MATLSLREGTVIGDTIIFPVYELDYDKMLEEIPGAFETGTAWVNTPVKIYDEDYHKFQVTSNNIRKYISSDIPKQHSRYGVPGDEVAGSICPVNCNYQKWTAFPVTDYGMERILSDPGDMNTNIHYLIRYQDSYMTSGSYDGAMYPCYRYMIGEDFSSSSHYTSWRDKNGVFMKSLFTDAGAHVYVAKCQWRNGLYNQSYNNVACIGFPPSYYGTSGSNSIAEASDAVRTTYTICDRNNRPFVDASGTNNPSNISVEARVFIREGGLYNAQYASEEAWTNINMYPFFIHYTVNGKEMYGICYAQYAGYTEQDWLPTRIVVMGFGTDFWGSSIQPGGGYHPGDWGSKTVRGGGVGTFNNDSTNTSDTDIEVKVLAHIAGATEASAAGIGRNVTAPGSGSVLVRLGSGQVATLMGALYSSSNFWQNWENKYFNPLSCILMCHDIPQELIDDVTLSSSHVCIAGTDFTTEVVALGTAQDIAPITMIKSDTITLQKYFDAFPDFEGYTKIKLHVPYIGEIPIPCNAVAHGKMKLLITADSRNGNMACMIWGQCSNGNSEIIATATGNCSSPHPIAMTSEDPSGAIGKILTGSLGMVAAGASLLAAPVTGGASLIAAGGLLAGGLSVGSGAADLAMSHPDTQIAFNQSAAVGLLCDDRVYLEIERPEWVETENYQNLKGLPAPLGSTLLDAPSPMGGDATYPFDGYTVVEDIDLSSLTCTDSEKERIKALLQSGVYIDSEKIRE